MLLHLCCKINKCPFEWASGTSGRKSEGDPLRTYIVHSNPWHSVSSSKVMGTTSQQPLPPTIINNIAGLCLSLSGKAGIILEQHFVKLLQSHENLRNRLLSSYCMYPINSPSVCLFYFVTFNIHNKWPWSKIIFLSFLHIKRD